MDGSAGNRTEAELAQIEARYLRTLVAQFGTLNFKGIARSGRPVALPLESVYVELKAVANMADAMDAYGADERRLLIEARQQGLDETELRMHLDSLRLQRWKKQGRGGRRQTLDRRSIEEAVADPNLSGLVILGDPGSGKTTLLHYLALRAAKAGLGEATTAPKRMTAGLYADAGRPRLPIFVPLAAFDAFLRRDSSVTPLSEFLTIYYERWSNISGLGPLFQQAFGQGRALVLLDGLDEVLDMHMRLHVANQARALIQQGARQGNRFVVTSRIVGYREAPLPQDLPHVTVLDFGLEEVELFAHRWCEAYELWITDGDTSVALQQAAREKAALLAEVRAHPSVLALAANPLLLTMLALLRRQKGSRLPEQRIELYRQYVETLLDNSWEGARSEGARLDAPVRFDVHIALEYLMELALWLQQNRPSGTARRQEIEDALIAIGLRQEGIEPAEASTKERLEATQNADRFLKEMGHFTGLLAERGQDAIGFLHLTFQEYLAGRALARMSDEERWKLLSPNLHRPRWRESILLCAGQIGIVDGRRPDVRNLARRVLGAGSPHEKTLHRDLFLISALAADDVGLDRRLLDQISERLIELQESRIPFVRRHALYRLSQFARQGHENSISYLRARIENKKQHHELAEAIQDAIGTEQCTVLRQAFCVWLEDADEMVRSEAVNVLGKQIGVDDSIRCLVMAKVDDKDGIVRSTALRALAAELASDEEIRRLLMAKAEDESESVRWAAIEALGTQVGSDDEIRRLLMAKAEDGNQGVHQASLQALGTQVGSDEKVRRLLMAKAEDQDSDIRWSAIQALGTQVGSHYEIRRLLMAKADDRDSHIRWSAIQALGTQVGSDDEIRHLLMAKAEDRDEGVRWTAISILISSVATTPALRALIIPKLDDMRWRGREEMVHALGTQVGSDDEIRRLLIAKADDWDAGVRRAALHALGSQVESNAEIRSLVIAKVDDRDESMRRAAIEALRSQVGSDDEIRRLLMAKADDRDEGVRWAALHALGTQVGNDEKIRRLLMTKVNDRDERVRRAALHALGSQVESNAEIRSLVIAKVDDRDESVRRVAIGALRSQVGSDEEIRRLVMAKADDLAEAMRRVAIYPLGAQAGSDEEIRRLVMAKVDDQAEAVRSAAVHALGTQVGSDEEIRRLLMAKADDRDGQVRQAAIMALGTQAANDEMIRTLIVNKIDDPVWGVRHAAIRILVPLLSNVPELQQRLLPWLGIVTEHRLEAFRTRQLVADSYAPLLKLDMDLRNQVIEMLRSPAWPTRQGAAWALMAMPDGPPVEAMPALQGLLEDERGEESWGLRLEVAETLLNDDDLAVSRRAISVTMEALDYASQPWYGLHRTGPEIRAQAAMALGELEPIYQDDAVFERLRRLIEDDDDDKVQDAAYKALLRLAVAPEARSELDSTDVDHDSAPGTLEDDQTHVLLEPASGCPMPSLPRSHILHLSDLHFGSEQNAITWYNELAEDLRELACTRIDAVILSGDIATYCTPEEYQAALRFLTQLSREFGIEKHQIIPVPGNHDLSWPRAKKAYELHWRDDYQGELRKGAFIEHNTDGILVRDEARYQQRFINFAEFYQQLRGEPYPLEYGEQSILYHLAEQRILILGLNSAWDIDHHFKDRASIHPEAISHALTRIRQTSAYDDCLLKLAVWHHPITSSAEDRITETGFLEQLAKAGFRLAVHGHIHKANRDVFSYDVTPTGRRIDIVSAGTFGAPVRDWVPGYPLQYNLLCFEGRTLTVETRCRQELNGAWKPDARWLPGAGKDPLPRYTIELFPAS